MSKKPKTTTKPKAKPIVFPTLDKDTNIQSLSLTTDIHLKEYLMEYTGKLALWGYIKKQFRFIKLLCLNLLKKLRK